MQATPTKLKECNLTGQSAMVIWSGCPYYREWCAEQAFYIRDNKGYLHVINKVLAVTKTILISFQFFCSFVASTLTFTTKTAFANFNRKCQN